ncbi:hypothetical protein VAE122_1080001 [Vibrio aestuarianus]|nr:hypothetical protein VAE122_1080001 [Vibrio aestuarianus]
MGIYKAQETIPDDNEISTNPRRDVTNWARPFHYLQVHGR